MKMLKQVVTALFSLLILAGAGGTAAVENVVYFHNDALGSPVAATDEQGQLLWREAYAPYGERVEKPATPNRLWYTGKPEESELGLNYFGARWYEPGIGRFHGIDPVDFHEENLQSFNRYAYANNNPYKYVDPDGRAAILAIFVPEAAVALGKAAVFVGTAITTAWYGNKLLNENQAGRDDGDTNNSDNAVTKRPSRVRKGTEQANWDNAKDGENDGKLCPTCGKEVTSQPGERNKDWDNDHVVPWRDRDLTGKNRKDVLDEYNRDTRLRCVNCNRSDNGS